MKNTRIILHIDLDAFFASCEERENPHFRGKPIVVGADPKEGAGRGVVSTCNYKAREYGIHSAMPISQAWRAWPEAIFLPVNGALYSRVSGAVMDILQDFSLRHNGKIEQVSVDEAEGDRSGLTYKKAKEGAMNIKKRITEREKITASVGIGPNMLIAKIASDFKKPDGLTIVPPKKVREFLNPLDIRKIPGIGPKTEAVLRNIKIKTVSDLARLSQSFLYDALGEHGIDLYNSSHGIDLREIAIEHETKSIGEEHTFEYDTERMPDILPIFFDLIKSTLNSARGQGFKNFKTITVKIRYSDFKTHTKSKSDKYSLDNSEYIEQTALKLIWPFASQNKKI